MSIQKQTYLNVADNSGALEIQCFHVVGSTRKREARLGDFIVAAVKKAIPGAQIKKGDVVKAVVVRCCKNYRRDDGSYIRFNDNAAVIIKNMKEKELVATRIFGPIPRELREKGFSKIVSSATEVV